MNKKLFLILTSMAVAAAAFWLFFARASAPELQQAHKESFRLGTFVRLSLWGGDAKKLAAELEAGDRYVADLEGKFSANIASSDIGRLNSSHGNPVEIGAETYDLLARSLEIARLTGGAFNPAIGDVVKLWKIGTPQARVPSDGEIAGALRVTSYKDIKIWQKNGKYYAQTPDGMSVDLGAIAKGRVADLLRAKFTSDGADRALIDLGGNLDVTGLSPKGRPWRLGIQAPDKKRGEYYGVVSVSDSSVVTSGPYERYFEKDGVRYHHIFDPATGRPALSDLTSVTIIDPDSTKADALCTALFVMGSAKAEKFLAKGEPIAALLVVGAKKEVLATPAAEKLFELTDKSLTLRRIGASK